MVFAATSGVTPDPDVIFTVLENGEAVLLHLSARTYYSLNLTGSRIWELLSQGFSLEEISSELVACFEVTIQRARQCVSDLAGQLVSEGLMRVTGDHATPCR